jgi:hypothetical protein
VKNTFKSCLSSSIHRYLKLKRALGRDFAVGHHVLEHLDKFLSESGATDLTQTEFEGWCKAQLHVSSGVRRDRMRIVRNLCLYRRRTEQNCFVPDDRFFPHFIKSFGRISFPRLRSRAYCGQPQKYRLRRDSCCGLWSCVSLSFCFTRLDCAAAN